MKRHDGVQLSWSIPGRRHLLLAGLSLVGSVFAFLIVTGSLLSVDNLSNRQHLNTAEDLLSAVAFVAGFAVAAPFVVFAVSRVRRVSAAGNDEIVLISQRRGIVVPISGIARVVVAPLPGPALRHAPAIVLADGPELFVLDAEARGATATTTVTPGSASSVGDSALHDRAWKVARELREHLGRLGSAAPGDTQSSVGAEPPPSFRRQTAAPTGAAASMNDHQVGLGRRVIAAFGSSCVIVILLIARAQSSSGHPFSVSQFLVGLLVYVAVVAALVLISFHFVPREIRVGDGWIASHMRVGRTWLIAEPSQIAAIVGVAGRQKFVRLSDFRGNVLRVPDGYLVGDFAKQFRSVLGSLDSCLPSARSHFSEGVPTANP